MDAGGRAGRRQGGAVRPLFFAIILVGSFLLFLIQPMFARMVLPRLGGSPSIWNVAMMFYQAALLGGYLYAHALQRLGLRTQVVVHLTLLIAATATLPIAPAAWLPDPGATPALWLVGLLAVSIGPAFFVVSAQAPLMQAWFAKTDDPAAGAPSFLYAASNIGSLAALLAYPLLLEPTTRLATQGRIWTVGYVVLIVLVGAGGARALACQGLPAEGVEPASTAPPGWAMRLRWLTLAFLPSGLLLSTTTHLTTDIVAMPLLWIIPLAAYLISFVFAFGSLGPALTRGALAVAPLFLVVLGGPTFIAGGAVALYFAAAGIALLLVLALAFHGTLAIGRPTAQHLTDFYLWISVGGALGGVFGALIAPMIFNWGYEQPILLVLAALMLPGRPLGPVTARLWASRRARPVLAYALPVLSLALSGAAAFGEADARWAAVMPIVVAIALSIGRRPQFAWHFAMLMLALGGWRQITATDGVVERDRSFFGVYAVTDHFGHEMRSLLHGTTLHGAQSLVPALATVPTTYYVPDSGVGRVLRAADAIAGPNARIAVVGLGAGTLACYAHEGQDWTAYEIDPVVVRIARDPHDFTFLARCRNDLPVVVGDARLKLATVPPRRYDILVVDAFSSDAPPLHLMTVEAFRLYARALAPGGVLVINVTNRFLDLERVVAAIAHRDGWSGYVRYRVPAATDGGQFRSRWIMLTKSPERSAAVLARLPDGVSGWRELREQPGATAWTDDFASILPVIKTGR